jgi:ATP-dependent RNA helicase MSS116
MGFRADIDAIVNFFPETPIRQTFLFSATVSPAIRQVARDVLDPDHVFIDVVPKDESPVHAHIPQHFTVLPSASEQIPHLVRLIAHDQLANPGNSKVMVFLNTTKQTQLFSTLLHELSTTTLPARSQLYEIHSKRTQAARTSASNAFRRDRSGAAILVTSDVSARGVDYPGVTRVIQVGIPASTEQYVHRVGRTGRAGKGGRADLVLLPFEQKFVRYQLSDVPIEELSHGTLLNQTTALAGKFESDPAAFFESSKEAESRPNDVTIKARRFRDKPNTVLGSLNTQVTGLIDQVDPDAIREVFVSLLGYYLPKAGDMHISRNSAYEELQKWTTEACGLPKPPFISEELLAKMGGVYGSSSRHSMERRPSRTNFGFKSPATRYINSERNRWQNDRTDREFARGPRWGGDENASSGSRWSGRGSRSSHGDSERRTFSRSERARDDRQNRWL